MTANIVRLLLHPHRPTVEERFAEFWAAYPHKVAKKYARDKFVRALKVASLETIMAGLERYKETKPAWKAWMEPSKFLYGERWEDEADAEAFDPSKFFGGDNAP